MNTFWAFGDSFTFGAGVRDTDYLNKINSTKTPNEICFINRLAKGYELKNFGGCGIPNSEILNRVYSNILNIKKGDIVLLGLTFWNRFSVHYNPDKTEHYVVGNGLWNHSDQNYKKVIDSYFALYYCRELNMKETFLPLPLIVEYLKSVGAKIKIWSLDEIDDKTYNQYQHFIKSYFLIPPVTEKYVSWFSPMVIENKLRISDECDINDFHLSIKGNDVFYNEINKQLCEEVN